jgi:hypothetical protein
MPSFLLQSCGGAWPPNMASGVESYAANVITGAGHECGRQEVRLAPMGRTFSVNEKNIETFQFLI